jgi:hypothetical protein
MEIYSFKMAITETKRLLTTACTNCDFQSSLEALDLTLVNPAVLQCSLNFSLTLSQILLQLLYPLHRFSTKMATIQNLK